MPNNGARRTPRAAYEHAIAAAKAAELDESRLRLDPTELMMVAESPKLRREFKGVCRSTQTSPILRDSLLDGVIDAADRLEELSKNRDSDASLIGRSGLAVSVPTIVGGLVPLAAGTIAIGPLVLLAGGLFSAISSTCGIWWMKRKSSAYKRSADRLRRFYEFLRSSEDG